MVDLLKFDVPKGVTVRLVQTPIGANNSSLRAEIEIRGGYEADGVTERKVDKILGDGNGGTDNFLNLEIDESDRHVSVKPYINYQGDAGNHYLLFEYVIEPFVEPTKEIRLSLESEAMAGGQGTHQKIDILWTLPEFNGKMRDDILNSIKPLK
jgi:hypothetical protein